METPLLRPAWALAEPCGGWGEGRLGSVALGWWLEELN